LPSQGTARCNPEGQARHGGNSQDPPAPSHRLSRKGLFDFSPLSEIGRLLLGRTRRQVTQDVTAGLARVE
jgi:hypothetical protein